MCAEPIFVLSDNNTYKLELPPQYFSMDSINTLLVGFNASLCIFTEYTISTYTISSNIVQQLSCISFCRQKVFHAATQSSHTS